MLRDTGTASKAEYGFGLTVGEMSGDRENKTSVHRESVIYARPNLVASVEWSQSCNESCYCHTHHAGSQIHQTDDGLEVQRHSPTAILLYFQQGRKLQGLSADICQKLPVPGGNLTPVQSAAPRPRCNPSNIGQIPTQPSDKLYRSRLAQNFA